MTFRFGVHAVLGFSHGLGNSTKVGTMSIEQINIGWLTTVFLLLLLGQIQKNSDVSIRTWGFSVFFCTSQLENMAACVCWERRISEWRKWWISDPPKNPPRMEQLRTTRHLFAERPPEMLWLCFFCQSLQKKVGTYNFKSASLNLFSFLAQKTMIFGKRNL